jgi:hypothetical protein
VAELEPIERVPLLTELAKPDPDRVFCVHADLQARHGIVNQENLALSALAAQGIYPFAYLYTPVPITGATGSIGWPISMWSVRRR